MTGDRAPRFSVAVLDLAGTTVSDAGVVERAFTAAMARAGLQPGSPEHEQALGVVRATMGQSKIDVFRRLLPDDDAARQANAAFEAAYAAEVDAGAVQALPGAEDTVRALRSAGLRVCLSTGFAATTRDAVLASLGWLGLADLVLSPADAGRGRPFPDMVLTALLRLGGGSVDEVVVAGDTPSDIDSGRRAGAGIVAGVLTGAGRAPELWHAGATHVLDTVADLPGLLAFTG